MLTDLIVSKMPLLRPEWVLDVKLIGKLCRQSILGRRCSSLHGAFQGSVVRRRKFASKDRMRAIGGWDVNDVTLVTLAKDLSIN